MKITKELEWVREYIDKVEHLVPKVRHLKKVSSKKGNRERWQHCHGLITYFDKKSYRITLYLTYHDLPSDKIKQYSTMDLLQYLAHELAHLIHWDHTPEHKILECEILNIFMVKLRKDGYTSEEDELKSGRFYKGE